MKTTMKTSCIMLAFLAMTLSASAQFSYGSKKKTTPTTATKDTVIAKPVNKPITSNQVVAAPTFSDVKPAKIIDTTVVGGFNANNKRSLRNGYAFFSETNSRKGVKERVPLPYENLREEDALFSEFVWEEIDAREKINRTFMYQSYDENGDQRFFAVLLRAIEKDGVVPFSTVDDRFTTPLTIDEVNASLKGSLDTQLVQNVLDPNVYDTSIIPAPNVGYIPSEKRKLPNILDDRGASPGCSSLMNETNEYQMFIVPYTNLDNTKKRFLKVLSSHIYSLHHKLPSTIASQLKNDAPSKSTQPKSQFTNRAPSILLSSKYVYEKSQSWKYESVIFKE